MNSISKVQCGEIILYSSSQHLGNKVAMKPSMSTSLTVQFQLFLSLSLYQCNLSNNNLLRSVHDNVPDFIYHRTFVSTILQIPSNIYILDIRKKEALNIKTPKFQNFYDFLLSISSLPSLSYSSRYTSVTSLFRYCALF